MKTLSVIFLYVDCCIFPVFTMNLYCFYNRRKKSMLGEKKKRKDQYFIKQCTKNKNTERNCMHQTIQRTYLWPRVFMLNFGPFFSVFPFLLIKTCYFHGANITNTFNTLLPTSRKRGAARRALTSLSVFWESKRLSLRTIQRAARSITVP